MALIMKAFKDPKAFPTFSDEEVARIEKFGEIRTYPKGHFLLTASEPAPGVFVILDGETDIVGRNGMHQQHHIANVRRGELVGELGQLWDGPAFYDARAKTDVTAILIKPENLRRFMVEDAGLNERMMRALRHRRASLVESDRDGPMLIGNDQDPHLNRLAIFMRRSGLPYCTVDAGSPGVASFIETHHAQTMPQPLVVMPNG
jgi:thioredoxin reductase (NADPH)